MTSGHKVCGGLVGLFAALLVVGLPAGLAGAGSRHSAPAGMTLGGGCKAVLAARSARGRLLDTASGPGGFRASPTFPFHLARGARIEWSGSVPAASGPETWWVHVDGLGFLSGSTLNASHLTSAAGTTTLDSLVPSWLGLTGRYEVTGALLGANASCAGALYVAIGGDPATGALLWVGIVLFFFGLALVLAARPTWYARYRVAPPGPLKATALVRRPRTTLPTGSVIKTRIVLDTSSPGRSSTTLAGRVVSVRVVSVHVVSVPVGVASSSTYHKSPAGVTLAGGCKGAATHSQDGKRYASASGPEAPGATPSRPFHLARGGLGVITCSGPTVTTDSGPT